MSTRSIIAIPWRDGWAGRYCHHDGYPTGMARELLTIVNRDGVDKARQVIVVEHYDWSSISADQPQVIAEDQAKQDTVEGYGTFYPGAHPADWEYSHEHPGDREWAYVLHEDRLTVLQCKGSGWAHRGDLPYGEHVTDEQLSKVECGEQYERCGHYAWVHYPDELPTTSRISMTKYLAGDFTED